MCAEPEAPDQLNLPSLEWWYLSECEYAKYQVTVQHNSNPHKAGMVVTFACNTLTAQGWAYII